VPLADARRLIFTLLLKRGQSMASTGAVKGRTQQKYVNSHEISHKS
jgi:hypothetical protein